MIIKYIYHDHFLIMTLGVIMYSESITSRSLARSNLSIFSLPPKPCRTKKILSCLLFRQDRYIGPYSANKYVTLLIFPSRLSVPSFFQLPLPPQGVCSRHFFRRERMTWYIDFRDLLRRRVRSPPTSCMISSK